MKLVIIEGVGKRETIKKYLGSDYDVFATAGHIRDLPSKNMSIDIKNNFEPLYEIIPDKKKVVKDLIDHSKKAEKVFLATDPDREGEAISWHIANILNLDANDSCRIVFNEISKNAVNNALTQPRPIDINIVNAQQARRVLDRLVGYNISPVLWKKIQKSLSAGRVQSVVLRLICEREREIQNFVPEEYWSVNGEFEKANCKPVFKANLSLYKNKKLTIHNENEMNEVEKYLLDNPSVVSNIKKTSVKTHAPEPFITSSMQKEATAKLNMSLKQVSSCAQTLYEGVTLGNEGKIALVTYIRTDSKRISNEAMSSAKDYIINNYGLKYVPTKPNFYKSKDSAQDAHEAIRPIDVNRTPESVKQFLKPELYKLYKLIYERFLASQMSEALYDVLSVEISCGDYTFKASDKTMTFAGYTAVYNDKDKTDNIKFPDLKENDNLKLNIINKEQKFTKPPLRYTESTLVDTMEEKGIGRPATYAQTITVLFSRKYVDKEAKNIVPTELGFSVNDLLVKYFDILFNVEFTAIMEDRLDKIAEGQIEWQTQIAKYYKAMNDLLTKAKGDEDFKTKIDKITDLKCDKCGSPMLEKEGRFGKFLACSGYPNCKNIVKIKQEQKVVGVCPKCQGKVVERTTKKGKIFYSCSNYPKCDFSSWNIPLEEKCPECNSYLEENRFRNSVTIKCSNSTCSYSRKKEKINNG